MKGEMGGEKEGRRREGPQITTNRLVGTGKEGRGSERGEGKE